MCSLSTRTSWILSAAALCAFGLSLAGCSKDKDKPDFIQRTGRVASIDKDTGKVSMYLYIEKERKEREIPGRLDPNVEIFINGAAASADDVRIDDEVKVLGRVEGSGSEKQFVVVKVEVTRPVIGSAPAASAPPKE